MHPFEVADLYLLSPELTLTLLALVVMLVDLLTRRRIVIVSVALIGLIVPVGLAISLALTLDPTAAHHAFFNMLVVDQYAIFFKIVFLLIAAVMMLASYDYVGKYVRADGEFYSLLLLSVVGMMFMASTAELITIYISLELTSIPLYVMAGLIRFNERSAEAAVKYVLLGAMSSAILLYGFALLYGLTGTTDLMGIATSIKQSVQSGNLVELNAAVLFFILVYVITNLGAFSGIIALADLTGGEKIEDFRGLGRRAPLLSAGTALCLLSLAGIPPVAGFWSKVFIFTAAWGLGQSWLVILALLNSIVSLVYYGRIVKAMYFDAPLKEDHLVTPLGLSTSIALTTAALLVITFAAQLVLGAASPAAGSLLAFLLGK